MKVFPTPFLALIFLSCGLPRALGAASLEDSRALYREAVASEESRRDAARESLRLRYAEGLDHLARQAQQAGHLDILLRIRDEQNKAKADTLDATADPDFPPALLATRNRFDAEWRTTDAESEARLQRLRATYLNHLAQLQRQLTRGNRIDEALAVRDEILAVDAASPTLSASPGPANGGLSLLWNAGKADQAFVLGDGISRREFAIRHEGGNRISENGLECRGGTSILPAAATEAIMARIQASKELTFVLGFVPEANPGQAIYRVVTFGQDERDSNILASQRFGTMYVRPRGGDHVSGIRIGGLSVGKPSLFAMSLKDGKPRYFQDGREIEVPPVPGDYEPWQAFDLLMGNDHGGQRPWQGVIRRIELHDRAMEPDALLALTQAP